MPALRPALLALPLALAAAPALSAQTTVVNVEVDWFTAGDHDHGPAACELDGVVQAFARRGVTLNIELSDSIPETAALEFIDGDFGGGEWATIESTYRDHPAGTGWHYGVFIHQYEFGGSPTTSSGLGELFGDEFMVSLGAWPGQVGTPFDRAGTFMHELGHNLGLTHSGDQFGSLVAQYKPNLPSVMAYRYQTRGVAAQMECEGLVPAGHPFHQLDYSAAHACTLDVDETALDESEGIGYGAVDWNCDGDTDDLVAVDLSSQRDWCTSSGTQSDITDFDEWANIISVADAPVSDAVTRVVTCTTREESDLIDAFFGSCTEPDPCAADPAPPHTCWLDAGGGSPGAAGTPELSGVGALFTGQPFAISLDAAPPSALLLAWLAPDSTPFALAGGTMHVFPYTAQLLYAATPAGTLDLATTWPASLPSGFEVWIQFLVQDASVPDGFTLSNALHAGAE